MENNKSCPKGEFGWSSYRKAPRRLLEAQMAELLRGRLRPLLDYVLEHPDVRFDIRPRNANVYFDGGSLLRLEGGGRMPLQGVFDLGYVGSHGLQRQRLDDPEAVESLVHGFEERKKQMLHHWGAGTGRAERRVEEHIARANDARSLDSVGDFVIFDIEYCYARRCFDFVALDRAGLPCPQLILAELKCRAGALHGTAGLRDHGIDFGELLCAEDGRHVSIVKNELAELFKQKQLLGLLSPDIPFEGFSSDPPEFLVMFADYDVCQAQPQTALDRLRTEVRSRLGSLELLRFTHLPEVHDEGRTDLLRLHRESVMDSDEFEAYRQRAL
jgi:hypothetical protein